MSSLNKVFLIGNLTRDPELKYTPNGAATCGLSIAVNRQHKDKDGEMKKDTQFFNIVTWSHTAENCGKYLAKGGSVLVEGRLQNRSWEKDGQKRTVTEIVAENVQFLSRKQTDDRPQGATPNAAPPVDEDPNEVPF